MKIEITIAEYLWDKKPPTYDFHFGKFSIETNGLGCVLIVFKSRKSFDRIITTRKITTNFERKHFKIFNQLADM